MIKYFLLASGSDGNCTLIQTQTTNILVDVGIGIREIEAKLATLNLKVDDIHAFFITHEHIDHIRALKYIPKDKVYSGAGTCDLKGGNRLTVYTPIQIGDVTITPIPLSHDCINGLGFVFQNCIEKLVYITDTGYISVKNHPYITDATHYIIESNHDIEMLLNSERPAYLIRRILSDSGHLNNEQCGEALAKLVTENTKTITLAHLSDVANDPSLALETVQMILKEYNINYQNIRMQSASRYDITWGCEDGKVI